MEIARNEVKSTPEPVRKYEICENLAHDDVIETVEIFAKISKCIILKCVRVMGKKFIVTVAQVYFSTNMNLFRS